MKTVMAPPLARVPVRQIRAGGQVIDASASYWQPLYDTRVVDTGDNVKKLEFFQRGFTGARTWEDTNIPTAGKLPGGQVFSVHGYAVKILAEDEDNPLSVVDFRKFQQGLFTFYIGDSVRFRLPLFVLGGMGGQAVGAGAGAASFVNNGSFSTNDYWRNPAKDYDDAITSEQNFRATLTWKDAAGWTAAEDMRIVVFLVGDLHTIIDRN